MRAVVQRFLLSLIFVLPFGCERTESPIQSQMHQVLGALQIPNKTERDAALATACCECAVAGDVESVMLGIREISEQKQRDEAAEECIQLMQAAGRTKDAMKILDLIEDTSLRSELSSLLNEAK